MRERGPSAYRGLRLTHTSRKHVNVNVKPALFACAALCAVVVAGGSRAAAQAVDNRQIANRLVSQFVEAQNTMNADLFDGVFATNYVQHNPHVPPGLKGVKNLFAAEFKQLKAHHIPLRVSAESVLVDGDRVVLVSITKFKQKGKWFQQRSLDEWRIADGRFAEHWDSDDAPTPSTAPTS